MVEHEAGVDFGKTLMHKFYPSKGFYVRYLDPKQYKIY